MFLYGASGHAKVIIDILHSQNISVEGLIDDNEMITELLSYPVFHNAEDFNPIIISIGDNKIREKVSQKLSEHIFGAAIHSSAIISQNSSIEEGSVVMQGVIIQSGSSIGKHCIVNTGASVDHDCNIGDFVHISPHSTLCGNIIVEEGSWIGAGTTIIPGVKIGKWCVIGAGTVVTKDIPDYSLAVGNRCKIIKSLK
ncbi:MAG: acetyltransferase [Petrimonas sp.]|nr:acetyltransferase [Petrimonas sp.]MEA5080294.1 acetyltransferase [Dysgonamonadaceae bacterium]